MGEGVSETVLDFDLVELRSRERELQSLAMRASTAEMGPAVFDGYLPLWYLEVISSHLDACLRYVRGLPNGLKRICLNLPFQHAKTTIVEMFIARALGVDPSLRIINASYGVTLARQRIDNVQRWMSHPNYQAAFATRFGAAATVDDDDDRKSRSNDKVRNTANAFQVRSLRNGKLVNLGGSFLSTSLNADLNGRPYDIIIIDDPHKNLEEAASASARQHVEDRYDAIFLSRQQEKSIQIITTTRMNPDDLVSHVVPKWKESGIPHAVLRFPAILDEDPASYDPRPPGHGLAQALYPGGPEKYSAESYRVMKIDQPPHVWETCYQQRPTTRTGDFFQTAWWGHYDPAELREVDRYWVSIDCAAKAAGASWTCADLWASRGPQAFKVDELRGHWDVRQFEREFMRWITDKWGREIRKIGSAIVIEDGGFGRTIHDDLEAAGVKSLHLLGTGGLSKPARASLVLDFVRNGLALLPDRSIGRISDTWVGEHKAEWGRFPSPPCDRVDAGVQALRWHLDLLRAS
jgi:hypothetical protein